MLSVSKRDRWSVIRMKGERSCGGLAVILGKGMDLKGKRALKNKIQYARAARRGR